MNAYSKASCHPERGLLFAPKREEGPQSKHLCRLAAATAAAGYSHENLT